MVRPGTFLEISPAGLGVHNLFLPLHVFRPLRAGDTALAGNPRSRDRSFGKGTFMKFAFDHVHLVCKDMQAMTEYFQRVFGAELERLDEDFHGAPNAILNLGGARMFVRGIRPGEKPGPSHPELIMGIDHFSFAMPDVAATVAWLKERGAEVLREPNAQGIGGRVTAFIRGPEDLRIELSERPAGG